MRPTKTPRVKICCIQDLDEAWLAIDHGADALGLVSAMPSGHAILLDSGDQQLPVKELGGTGRTHDWRLSRRIREAAPAPVFLAGGLRPDNVADGIRQVRPFAVDLCSGVRTEGKLDADKLRRFFAGVAAAGSTP